MSYLFSDPIPDMVRNRNNYPSLFYRSAVNQTNNMIPAEVDNLSLNGITPNGTYFFCNLLYKKGFSKHKRIHLLTLIDEYAEAQDSIAQLQLKKQIIKACGEQVDGIALLFSSENATYGFVTGKRVKIAKRFDTSPLELTENELFHYPEPYMPYFVFLLEEERDQASEFIKEYLEMMQKDQFKNEVNTDVINAIKRVTWHSSHLSDLNSYLKAACSTIQNQALKQQVLAVYDSLKLLYNEEKIKFKATVLTLQLLHASSPEKRIRSLKEYTKLASTLYDSKIPGLMIAGICLFLLGASFLAVNFLNPIFLPLSITIIGCSFIMVFGLLLAKLGKDDFYCTESIQKRSIANTLFSLKNSLTEVEENPSISRKIKELPENFTEELNPSPW